MQRLKLKRVSWCVLVSAIVFVLALFVMQYIRGEKRLAACNEAEQQLSRQMTVTRQELDALRLKVSGVSNMDAVDMATRANYNFIQPGEVRFSVENSEMLDNYTEEEWQIMMDERKMRKN